MWRIVAMGAVPAALLGAGTGLFYSHNFVDYQPMGEIYLAQDSVGYAGGPPPYVQSFLGGSGPFYVAPGEAWVEPTSYPQEVAERPAEWTLAALSVPAAPSVADRAADAAALERVPAPNPAAPRQIGAAINVSSDSQAPAVEHDVKNDDSQAVSVNLDAPP